MAASDPNLQFRTLRRAALLLGGERKLAEFLDIEGWLVSRWLEGLGHPPDFIFSRCTDLIESMSRSGGLKTEVNGLEVAQRLNDSRKESISTSAGTVSGRSATDQKPVGKTS
jgi:hypothetical protein